MHVYDVPFSVKVLQSFCLRPFVFFRERNSQLVVSVSALTRDMQDTKDALEATRVQLEL